MKTIARIVFVIGVFLAWVLPLAAVPFVNIMPYLFSSTFGERFLISLATTALLAVCWWFACNDGNRRSLVSPRRARKDALNLALGTVAVTCIPAILGANVLGIFVTGLKNQPVRHTLEVVDITEKTRKEPRTRWELACARSEARFEVVLADKMLAVPAVQVGSRVTLSGRRNFVGTYVEQVAVTPKAEPTC
ncbi:hypothetical protein ACFFTM_00025 [Pseudoduganella plicata]|uniref:DUF5666 domain-containing protein n=1 Tax=Pseudoduganella plicata TaxID=321984 RepID=A0A4P7BE99_9BURK|nr:hypothetical protein [Pseudoduganella plicata]QBQ36432.1 hypothetical protein E1742_09865 [Pseudoduganella plicata]GGY75442.1 hypothetical protein GCM10007388_04910 [Pseudoduganella plicata]